MNKDLCLARCHWVVCLQMNVHRVYMINLKESALVRIIYSCADIYEGMVEEELKATLSCDYSLAHHFPNRGNVVPFFLNVYTW